MKTRIQTYMHINDIIPTEDFLEEIVDNHIPPERWTKEQLIKDIDKNGIKYQLRVDPFGRIINGNLRYWVARHLNEENESLKDGLYEDNWVPFEFLPVEIEVASGILLMHGDTSDEAFLKKVNTKIEAVTPRDDPHEWDGSKFRPVKKGDYQAIFFRIPINEWVWVCTDHGLVVNKEILEEK